MRRVVSGMPGVRTLVLLAAAACLASCASSPATLEAPSSRDAGRRGTPSKLLSGVEIVKITDRREKGATLSDLSGRPMAGVDVLVWLEGELEIRGATSTTAAEAIEAVAGAPGCQVEIELRRVTTQPQATSITSSVVLGAQRRGGEYPYKVLRGQDSRMNWASGSGETNDSLKASLDQAAEALAAYCK